MTNMLCLTSIFDAGAAADTGETYAGVDDDAIDDLYIIGAVGLWVTKVIISKLSA